MPRKRKVKFTPEMLKMLENLAAIRLPQEDMATVLGISRPTFQEMLASDETLRQTLNSGRSRSKLKVFKTLYDSAFGREAVYDKNGKLLKAEQPPSERLMMYWCDTQEAFVKASKLEVTGTIGVKEVAQTEEELLAELEELRKLRDDKE